MTTLNGSKMPLLKVLASPFLRLKQVLTPCEDYWTWITLDGKVYEDVALLASGLNQVTIRHKYGVALIAKSDLSEQVQKSLKDDLEIAESVESHGDEEDHFLNQLPISRANRLSKAA